jgi:hypothetical protein
VVALSNGIGPLIGAALASSSQDGWYVPSMNRAAVTFSKQHVLKDQEPITDVLQAMDLPPQSLHSGFHDGLLPFLHAPEKDPGTLERVSAPSPPLHHDCEYKLILLLHYDFRKLKAVDFCGVGLTLLGSTLLIVRNGCSQFICKLLVVIFYRHRIFIFLCSLHYPLLAIVSTATKVYLPHSSV